MSSDNRPDFRIPLLVVALLAVAMLLYVNWENGGALPSFAIPSNWLNNNYLAQIQVALQPFFTWVAQVQSLPPAKKILICLGIVAGAGAAALAPFYLFDLGRGTVRAMTARDEVVETVVEVPDATVEDAPLH